MRGPMLWSFSSFDSLRLGLQLICECTEARRCLVVFEVSCEPAAVKRPHAQIGSGLLVRRWHGFPYDLVRGSAGTSQPLAS